MPNVRVRGIIARVASTTAAASCPAAASSAAWIASRPCPRDALRLSITVTRPRASPPMRAAAVSAAASVPLTRRVRLIETTASKCEARNSNCRRKSPGGGCEVFGGSPPRAISA